MVYLQNKAQYGWNSSFTLPDTLWKILVCSVFMENLEGQMQGPTYSFGISK